MSISSTRRRQSGLNPVLALFLVAVAVVGVIATLHFTGQVPIDAIDRLLGRKEVKAAGADTIAVTLAVRPLDPGHRIVRGDLWNPETNFFQVIQVPRGEVREEWYTKPDQIEGRVLRNPKLPGKVFTEADFLPAGSRDGAVALVPEGMTLITLDGSKIRGLDQLKFKDAFVLLVSEPVDPDLFQQAERVLEQRGGNDIEKKLELAALKDMAYQRVLVNKGIVIRPARGGTGKEAKDVAIAVLPEEVAPVLAALDLEHNIYCAARSGLAGAEEANPLQIPDQEPPVKRLEWLWESVQEVEILRGNERTSVTVPKATAAVSATAVRPASEVR